MVCSLAKLVTLSPSSWPLAMWLNLKLNLTKTQAEERLSVDGVSMVFWEENRTVFQHMKMPKSKTEVASNKRNHFGWSWEISALLCPSKCVCFLYFVAFLTQDVNHNVGFMFSPCGESANPICRKFVFKWGRIENLKWNYFSYFSSESVEMITTFLFFVLLIWDISLCGYVGWTILVSHLVMVYDSFNELLNSVSSYFIEDFCIYVHHAYWLIVFS